MSASWCLRCPWAGAALGAPGPIPPSVRSSSRMGVIVGRGWTQPGGRPHAEIEALAPRRRGGPRRHALRDARALLASRQVAALRRRHHRRRHRARRLRARRPQPEGRRRRATRGCARPASRSTSASAPPRRAATMPATSGACATAGPTSRSSSRSRPTARPARPAAGRWRSPASGCAIACISCARRAMRS